MKRWICCFLAGCWLLAASAPVSAANEPHVSARSAILIEADTGRVVFSVNPDEPLAMASTTKIMTALLTLEEAEKENREVEITKEMILVEGSSMGLKEGNKLTLKDLAAGMLVVSGNDAANAAAIAVSGSLDAFVERMNAKAQELGLTHTSFETPSGLDGEAHFSTARDMASLAAYALQNPDFASIVSQPTYRVTYSVPEQSYVLTNHNKLLKLYEGCIGVKTGFTKKAGRCLVSAAEKNGVRLIAVTLNAPDDWNDHIAMYEYGFSQISMFQPKETEYCTEVSVVGGERNTVRVNGGTGEAFSLLSGEEDALERRVELPRFLYAPLQTGDVAGEIIYSLQGKEMARIPILVQENVSFQKVSKTFWEKVWETIWK